MSSSSSVSGVMSKQYIMSGDSVVVYLLRKTNNFGYYMNQGQSTLTSNEGSKVLFTPIALPIKASVSDFGIVVDVERGENVLKIEEYFKAPIEKIFARIGDDRNSFTSSRKIESFFDSIFICMEHRDVFDKMIEFDKKSNPYKSSFIYFTVLEMLGFECVELIDDRYYKKYTHKDFENIIIYSDDMFINIEKDGDMIDKCYNVGDLLKILNLDEKIMEEENYLSLHIKFAEECSKKMIEPEPLSKECIEIVEKLKKLIINNKKKRKSVESEKLFKKEYDILCDQLAKIQKKSKLDAKEEARNEGYISTTKNISSNLEMINKTSVFDQNRVDLINHYSFVSAMYSTSSLFMPTFSGYNDCMPDSYNKELHKLVKDFLK